MTTRRFTARFTKLAEGAAFAAHIDGPGWSAREISQRGKTVTWVSDSTNPHYREDMQDTVHYFGSPEFSGMRTKTNTSWITNIETLPEEATVTTTTTPATTPTTTTELRPGMHVRLANRPADMGDQIVEVGQVVKSRNKAAIYTATGELYVEVGFRAKFEVHPAPKPKPAPKPAPARVAAPTGGRVKKLSPSALRALGKLIATEGGSLTRQDLHADPMVVVALENRGLATVDRTAEKTRGADLIEITPAGREAFATGGRTSAVVPSPKLAPAAKCADSRGCDRDAAGNSPLCGFHSVLVPAMAN